MKQSEQVSIEQRESTGIQDKHGVYIREGDYVRFYFDVLYGYGESSEDGMYTEMIDHVEKHDDRWYFVMDGVGMAPAIMHARHCEIIGNDSRIEHLLTNKPL